MATIEGQIETLKSIKRILHENGISRFGSVSDLNNFLRSFESEKIKIRSEEEDRFQQELDQIQLSLEKSRNEHLDFCEKESKRLNCEIATLKNRAESLRARFLGSLLSKAVYFLPLFYIDSKLSKLENNRSSIFQKRTKNSEEEVRKLSSKFDTRKANRVQLISESTLPKVQELERTKVVIEGLQTLIAGAIGEDLVVKEIRKLPDDFTLFNDFYIEFSPPIYNKKEDDRIYSIQIDHLLVSNSGIFIIETKNWSKKSLENLDLRSPVKQIMRSSYALFVLLNSNKKDLKIPLSKHHWGSKQIPIRNLIVMIHGKPKEAFQYVKVKTIKELNGYISHFEKIFNDDEVANITNHIRSLGRGS